MPGRQQRVIQRAFEECFYAMVHLFILGAGTALLLGLLGSGDWSQALLAGFLIAIPLRYISLVPRFTSRKKAPWSGWLLADVIFLFVVSGNFSVIEQGGLVLFGAAMLGPAILVGPLVMARYNALLIISYMWILSRNGVAVDSSAVWVAEVPVLILFAFMSLVLSMRAVQIHSRKSIFGDVLTNAFESLHVNLALLDGENRFIKVNSRAQKTLEKTEHALKGVAFEALISPHPEWVDHSTDQGAQSGVLTQRDGRLCPVAYEKVPLSLPGGVVDENAPGDLSEVQLVLFSDMSDIVKGQEAISLQKRTQTINTMLEVFADGVRNPLAGISAYVQTLERMENKAVDGEVKQRHLEIYQRMIGDITDLDQLLESLINNTRMTPDEVETHFTELKEKRQRSRNHEE